VKILLSIRAFIVNFFGLLIGKIIMSGKYQVTLAATEQVMFGRPASECIKELVQQYKFERVLILASKSLNENTSEISNIEAALGCHHAATIDGIQPHAPRADVIKVTDAIRSVNADLVVTVGGGSVTDAGKIAALLVKHNVTDSSQMEALRITMTETGEMVNPLDNMVDAGPDIAIICVPTTLSGGEFNPLSGATDEVSGHKQAYSHREMAPKAIILDPAITVHTPEWLWISTGVRSIDHCVETLASHLSNDFADGLAANALRMLSEGLKQMKTDPQDLDARLKCQIGAWQSMVPIIGGVPMGASHAIGHILGGACNVPHGYTSCVMSPYVLEWNRAHDESRQVRICEALGAGEKTASEALDELIRMLGMPRTLTEVGVSEDKFDMVADLTLEDIWGRTNPRPIVDANSIKEILKMAM
jgi:maleylacetate reductase